jgi:predicted metal-dependent HD superfamily phosphohydrolase
MNEGRKGRASVPGTQPFPMKDRWQRVWQKLGAPGVPQGVLEELLRAYSSPERYYHNLAHIQDCLSIFD